MSGSNEKQLISFYLTEIAPNSFVFVGAKSFGNEVGTKRRDGAGSGNRAVW
jgi:hypothetical protein